MSKDEKGFNLNINAKNDNSDDDNWFLISHPFLVYLKLIYFDKFSN